MSLRSIFIKLLPLILGVLAVAAFGQNPINPVTQISWPLLTASGAPSGACGGANYAQPYLDTTGNNYYVCGSSGWILVTTAAVLPANASGVLRNNGSGTLTWDNTAYLPLTGGTVTGAITSGNITSNGTISAVDLQVNGGGSAGTSYFGLPNNGFRITPGSDSNTAVLYGTNAANNITTWAFDASGGLRLLQGPGLQIPLGANLSTSLGNITGTDSSGNSYFSSQSTGDILFLNGSTLLVEMDTAGTIHNIGDIESSKSVSTGPFFGASANVPLQLGTNSAGRVWIFPSNDVQFGNSTDNGQPFLIQTASGTYIDSGGHWHPGGNLVITIGTGTVTANSCTSNTTVTATGINVNNTIVITPRGDLTFDTGWNPASSGQLYFQAYPTTNTLNYEVCNPTGSNITMNNSTQWNVSFQ